MTTTHPVATPASAETISTVLAGQDALQDWQESLYKHFHENPELSTREVNTAARIAAELSGLGFDVTENVGGHGVIGTLHNGDGPVVLMRADIDALPVTETTGLPYASTVVTEGLDGLTTGVMHACGHDTHISTLLGAARLLSESKDAWAGTYIALFQPAEETADGAKAMADDDLADRIPHPDVALAQHVMPVRSGRVATRPGPLMAVADSIRVTVYGRGGHGSMPMATIDPVPLVASIVQRLNLIVARELNPADVAVLTIGRIEVGTKSNVIADHGVLELNMRTFSNDVRTTMLAAIHRIVDGECAASGSPKEATYEYYDHFPLTDNNAEATATVEAALGAHFGDLFAEMPAASGSEDFSEIPNVLGVPYCYWVFGGTDQKLWDDAVKNGTVNSTIPVNHSPNFAPEIEPTLRTGTAAAVVNALAWLAR